MNYINVAVLTAFGGFQLATLGMDTPLGALMFFVFLSLSAVGIYLGYHTRVLKLDDSHLYVGYFAKPGFVKVPLGNIESLKLHRPLFNMVVLRFSERTKVGDWLIWAPKQPILGLSYHRDVIRLKQLIAECHRDD